MDRGRDEVGKMLENPRERREMTGAASFYLFYMLCGCKKKEAAGKELGWQGEEGYRTSIARHCQ